MRCLLAHDVEGYTSFFAEDAVVDWPFATDVKARVQGRAALAEYLRENLARLVASGRRFVATHDVVTHATERALVVEFAVEIATAESAIKRPYVHVYEFDAAGRITRMRDYFGVIARPNLALQAFAKIEAAVEAWDADLWANAFAENGAIEWRFAPEGFPRGVSGREAIRVQTKAMMERATAAGRKLVRYHDVKALSSSDPEVAVVEYKAERELADGTRSSLDYVWVLETKNGEIVHLRDYYDSAGALKLVRPST